MGDVVDLSKRRIAAIDAISRDVFEEAMSEGRQSISLSFVIAVVKGIEYVVLADVEWGDGSVTNDLVALAKEIEPMLRKGQYLKVVRIDSIPLNLFRWSEANTIYHCSGRLPDDKT